MMKYQLFHSFRFEGMVREFFCLFVWKGWHIVFLSFCLDRMEHKLLIFLLEGMEDKFYGLYYYKR